MNANKNYANLKDSYLFSTIGKKVREFAAANPQADIIKLGIGDVTLPLVPAVVKALSDAALEMGDAATFRGYGPEQGYDFLRSEIRDYYAERGVAVDMDEIFVSDGAKSDIGNFLDLFSCENTVLVPDPVYPVYVDTNTMAGRRVRFVNATKENGFLPLPDRGVRADIIYICSPNNPTGAVYDKAGLKAWVDYAAERGAIIMFDAAYETFVSDPELPRSIFEIEGARECAVEFCSFSKFAGFTGTRCGYTVVPKELIRDGMSLNRMWLRRQTTKYNGVPYIVQRGAQAAMTKEGRAQCRKNIEYYMENAKLIADGMRAMGKSFTGGVNSPYIWLECGGSSWDYFDMLLKEANVVGTPGAGFGKNGEGYFRLTAFGSKERTAEAVERLKKL